MTRNETTFYPSKAKQIFFMVLSMVFVATGIWMMLNGNSAGYLCAGFFGLALLVLIIQMLPGASYLTISENGFEYSSLYRRRFESWADIKEFKLFSQKDSRFTSQKMVGWTYTPTALSSGTVQSIAKGIPGIEAGLPDTYGLTADALKDVLMEYWSRNK